MPTRLVKAVIIVAKECKIATDKAMEDDPTQDREDFVHWWINKVIPEMIDDAMKE